MKIQLGVRGSTDAINHIIIKIDDLMLVTADNLFLVGEELKKKNNKDIYNDDKKGGWFGSNLLNRK